MEVELYHRHEASLRHKQWGMMCVCVFDLESQMEKDKVFTYVCVCVYDCKCWRLCMCGRHQLSVNEQNLSPSACVYMFPTVDLKAQYQ